jgi:hypothetical protein
VGESRQLVTRPVAHTGLRWRPARRHNPRKSKGQEVLVRKSLVIGVVSAVAASFAVTGTAQAGDNWIGSWKLNAAKSKLGDSAVRPRTLKFEKTADGIKLTAEGTDAQGKPMQTGYTAKFDGTPAPWPGNPMADSAAPKKIDDNTYENVWTHGGKVTVTAKVSVSADGKTLTVAQTGTDPSGAKVSSVAVYDKQ